MFDVSHMGEVFVEGPAALEFLNHITINDASKLSPGKGQYTAMLNENGGMIDDLIMYQLEDQKYLLCVNASNTDKDFKWIEIQSKKFDVTVNDRSAEFAQLAIQGPTSTAALKNILDSQDFSKASELPYTGICGVNLNNEVALIARTGYTGEKGYEIYMPTSVAKHTWETLLGGPEKFCQSDSAPGTPSGSKHVTFSTATI